MNRALILTTMILSCILATTLATSSARADEPSLGDIKLTGVGFSERGWVHCEGQTLQISENTALFSLLGTTYGGDGRSTFKLPDLRKAEAALRKAAGIKEDSNHLRYMIAVVGLFPSRN